MGAGVVATKENLSVAKDALSLASSSVSLGKAMWDARNVIFLAVTAPLAAIGISNHFRSDSICVQPAVVAGPVVATPVVVATAAAVPSAAQKDCAYADINDPSNATLTAVLAAARHCPR
jgi:hypothetical protein